MKMRQTIKVARYFDKQARDEGQNRFDDLPKDSRKALNYDPGELDFKRLLLPSDPKLREKVSALRKIVQLYSTKYPEIIGATLYGSYIKGYANGKSDLDVYVLIDEDKVRASSHDENSKTAVEDSPRFLQIKEDVAHGFSYAGLQEEWSGVTLDLISKSRLVRLCHISTGGIVPKELVSLFHPAIGKGIYEYRKLIISTLEQMKEQGAKVWDDLTYELFCLENMDFAQALLLIESKDPYIKASAERENVLRFKTLAEKRRNLYHMTLAKGREKFLGYAARGMAQS